MGGDDLALPVVAVAVELAGSHHPAERGARPLVQGGHLVGERHARERPLQRCQLALAGVWHHEPGLRAAPGALADEGQAHLLAPELAQDLESPAAELFQIGLLETSGASEERSLGLREPALGAPPLN